MEYNCSKINIDRLPIGPDGVVYPLCNSCKTKDCSHKIVIKEVSVFGYNEKFRVLESKYGRCYMVVQCEGYME